MSTFADKPVRVFRSRSEELKSRLRRKRSCGRLKAFNSNTDNRSWVCNDNERRRHILELLSTYETTLGNYIPFDELFAALRLIGIPAESSESSRIGSEILAQQKEMSELAKCLTKAGGDLKKENKCLKEEIDRLKQELEDCQKCKQKLCAQLRKCKGTGDCGSRLRGSGSGTNSCSCIGSNSKTGGLPSLKEACSTSATNNCPPKDPLGGCPNDASNDCSKICDDSGRKACESEKRINELLCEIQGLQKCLEKAECDAIQMLQLIEQQQEQLNEMKMLECKLKEVTKQRDMLQCQVGQNKQCSQQGIKSECASTDKSPDCKDKEICELNKQLIKQSECIASLKEKLMAAQCNKSNSGGSGGGNTGGNCGGCQSGYGADADDVKVQMTQLQCKVSQQAAIIVSQRKCLLEQHKYILDQEQIKNHMQNKVRDQSRKQAELVYERNLLRNEIVFLTARLKTYLGKIQVLERSIEQFFDNTKAESCAPQNNSCEGDEEDALETCCFPDSEDTSAECGGGMRGRSSSGCGTGSAGGGGGGCPCSEIDNGNDMEEYSSPNKCPRFSSCGMEESDGGLDNTSKSCSASCNNNSPRRRSNNFQDRSSYPEKDKGQGPLRQSCCTK